MKQITRNVALVAALVVAGTGAAGLAAEPGGNQTAAVHGHGHGHDAPCITTATQEQGGNETAFYGWRWVTHFGCGFTGYYRVKLNSYNFIICSGCWNGYWAYVW